MDLQTTRQLNIDVSNHKYLSIDAKQYDRNLRYVLITCYHQGSFLPINKNTCFASVRYRKPDNYGVFNTCEITQDGRILVELTEQMLAVAGICYADVVIHENLNLAVNIIENADGSVEIIDTGNSGIISTMTFVVNVREAAFDNKEIESSYEYDALNDLLNEAVRDYEVVLTTSLGYKNTTEGYMETTESYKNTTEGYMETTEDYMDTAEEYKDATISYTVGGTETRDGENEDNAKYYYEQSLENADSADRSEAKALEYRNLAQSYAVGGTGIEERPDEETDNAWYYYKESSQKASDASGSATAAATSQNEASKSQSAAAASETNALAYANRAQSYTVGGTGTRDGEDTDNASWYYNEVKDMFVGLNIVFVPKGTISFSELAAVKETAVAGYVYNISDDFVTDETFMEGSGMTYIAGTNVYYVIDDEGNGKWDCFGGAASPTATVDEVKEYLGI